MFAFWRQAAAAVAVCVCLAAISAGRPDAEVGDEHLVMGNPTAATSYKVKANNYLVRKKQYALSYNNDKGTPNWVSWNLNKKWLGKTRRKNPFAPDTSLPGGFFVRPNDYRASGFDRGHMCPSADRSASQEDQDATFLMSNMVPQAPDLNRKTWEKLEEYARNQARDDKKLYIVAGPAGKGGWGENGYRTYLHGSGGKIVVPAHCWKVVLILPSGVTDPKKVTTENAKVAAVIMPNIQGPDPAWRTYQVTVRDVEDLTGYTFFSALAPDVAKELKDRKPTSKAKVAKEPGKKTKTGSKAGAGGTLTEFVEGCVVGNRKSKKYHVPGGRSYRVAKNSKNAVFFKTEADAKAAGYTPVKRVTSATKGGSHMAKSSVLQALKKASEGLLFPSETDAPFEAFAWPEAEGKPDKARVLELAGLPANTPVRTKTLDGFFKDATTEQDWHNENEKAEVTRFRQFVEVLKGTLKDVKVFQVGRKEESDAYIVGRAPEAGWAGLKTKVVET